MAGRPSPLPDALGAVFTRGDALRLGLSTRRLSYPDVERIGRGLYRRRRPEPEGSAVHPQQRWRDRQLDLARAYRGRLGPGTLFAGRTAAVLWGLPVPMREDDRLETVRLSPARASRDPVFRTRETSPLLVTPAEHHGLPLTDPATTWAMLGSELHPHDLVAVGDAVIHEPRIPGTSQLKRPPFAGLGDLEAAVGMGRRRGASRLRAALPLLSPRSASRPESHFRMLLREWGAPEPELDYDVSDANGRLVGCSEFAYPQYRLAFEYEGAHHLHDAQQWNRDIEKYRHYAQLGWEVVQVTSALLYPRRSELRYLAFEALCRRGWR